MRILIVTPLFPPDIGGPATYSKKIADTLPEYDIQTTVVSFGSVRHLPIGIRHLVFFFWIVKASHGCKLIFAQDPVSVGIPAALACLVVRKPLVLKIVGDYAWEQGVQRFGVEELLDEFLNHRYGFYVECLRWFERFSAWYAKTIIVPSDYLKSVVVQWGIPTNRIVTIHNDISLPSNLFSKQSARAKIGFAADAIVLFSAGRLVPWKGFDTLVDIMPAILKKFPNATLFIAGDGPLHRFLIDRIYAKGLEHSVFLLGSLSRPALFSYLSASDIFLLNTGYEGFSHQLIEAFAAGSVVATTLSGGNKEVVKHRINALIVPYNDVRAWEQIIIEALTNASLCTALSGRAQNDAAPFLKGLMTASLADTLKKAA